MIISEYYLNILKAKHSDPWPFNQIETSTQKCQDKNNNVGCARYPVRQK